MSKKDRGDWLLFNPITMHPQARWIALITYIIGVFVIQGSRWVDGTGGLIMCYAGLIMWIIPVMWCAKMFATGGKK